MEENYGVNAVDYLLKPFDEERLKKAIERAKREIGQKESASGIKEQLRNLLHLEGKLDPGKFVCIHRSTIVNLDSIKSLHPLFNREHIIILRNGAELNMSRTYHQKLISLLA